MRIRQATRAFCALAALTAMAWVFAPAASAADAGQQARKLFLDPDGRLMCAARAGDTLSYPANSQQAFESSAGMGVDIITTTARLTKDGQFVLMESENTLGTCVDGKGADVNKRVSDLTLDEIKTLQLKPAGSKALSGCPVLTLTEALVICKGTCLLMVSVPEEQRGKLAEFVTDYKAEDFVILRGKGSGEGFAAWAPGKTDMATGYYGGNIVFMATREIGLCFDNKIPAVELSVANPYGVIFNRFIMKRFEGRGRAMISTADESSCGKREDNALGWDNLAAKGYSIIETDYAPELMLYIKDIESARGELERRIKSADALCSSGAYEAAHTGELRAAADQGQAVLDGVSTSLSRVREAAYEVNEALVRLQNGTQAEEKGAFSATPGRIAAAVLCAAAILAAQVYTYKKSRKNR